MTNKKMLDSIAALQTFAVRSGHNKEHSRMLFWLVADMGWELMCARGINGVDWDEFKQKQDSLFEMAWKMVNGEDTDDVKDPWVRKLYDEVKDSDVIDILNADVIE